MKRALPILVMVLIATVFLAGVGQTVLSQHQKAQLAVPAATEAPRLGELVLPYLGEGTVEFSIDEEWGTFSFSVPKPASVTEMSCDEIGWEFDMNPRDFPIQPLAGEDSISLRGMTYVDIVGDWLVITVVAKTQIHKLMIPASPTLEYGTDRFALGPNGRPVRTFHQVSNDAEATPRDGAGGSCSCGAGRCSASCSAGYHPSCTNCGRAGESCRCFKNRGSLVPEIEEMEYEATELPGDISSP